MTAIALQRSRLAPFSWDWVLPILKMASYVLRYTPLQQWRELRTRVESTLNAFTSKSEELEALPIDFIALAQDETGELRQEYIHILKTLREFQPICEQIRKEPIWDWLTPIDAELAARAQRELNRLQEAVQTTRALIAWAIGENDDEELAFDFSVSEPPAQPKAKSVHLSL
jgi:hypothetical protein